MSAADIWLIASCLPERENTNSDSDFDGSKMDRANRNFSRNHAMVIHLNAIAMIATVVYGFSLSSTLTTGL
jgi:hypothetical protein